MNNTNEEGQTKRSHVPWMHFNEWKQVYEDVYSDDINLLKRGYERLLLWKARQPHLPGGVESTLVLIHVYCLDQEVSKEISSGKRSVYGDHDLQLMCAAAITRFLNHVSNIIQTTKDTLYKMAEKLNIPDWLVQLRHTSAHGSNLPTLSVLRMAVKFALGWLKENYWKKVATIPNWVVTKSNSSFKDKRIEEILDVWQALKMYQMNGYVVINEIPDKKLRDFITKLLLKKVVEGEEKVDQLQEYPNSLLTLINEVEKKLLSAIRLHHSKKGEPVVDKVIALLLQSESFIPAIHYITYEKAKGLTHETILNWICEFWNKFLIHLQKKYALFPNLVHKLLGLLYEEPCQHRQLVIALWIKQLCISMRKSQILFQMTLLGKTKNTLACGKSLSGVFRRPVKLNGIRMKKFQRNYPDLRCGFLAPVSDDIGNTCSVADVKFAVLNPNEFTALFLPSLLNVARPSIPDSSKGLLNELVAIYTKTSNFNWNNDSKKIYTVADLDQQNAEIALELKLDGIDSLAQSPINFASEYEWGKCPLGVLPWHRDTLETLEIPSKITWKTPHRLNEYSSDIVQNLVKSKVNWTGVMNNVILERQKNARKRRVKLREKKKMLKSNVCQW